LTWHK